MRVVSAERRHRGLPDDDGGIHDVAIDLVGPVRDGDTLLVHAGVAIGQLESAGA